MRGGYSVAMARFMLRHPCLEYICGNGVRYILLEKKLLFLAKNTKPTNVSDIFSRGFKITNKKVR